MTFPQQFGLPQILLAVVAVGAAVMLLSSVVGLRRVMRSDDDPAVQAPGGADCGSGRGSDRDARSVALRCWSFRF